MAYCEWTHLPDGRAAMIRYSGRRPITKQCKWCDDPVTQLCDYVISPPEQITHVKTCDAPMCRRHAQQVEPDKDFCPDHAGSVL